MTFYKPEYEDNRDYKTNAPTYYDYLAKHAATVGEQEKEVQELLQEDITRAVSGVGDLVEVTDSDPVKSRHTYEIEVKNDNTKEQRLEGGSTIKVTSAANATSDRTKISVNPEKVLYNENLKGENGVKATQTQYGVTVSADTDKLQTKLNAGENIIIENGNISAIGDANVKSREPKFNHYLYSGRALGTFAPIEKPAVTVSYSADILVHTGKYFLAFTDDNKTPCNKIGWLEVLDAEPTDGCIQTFTNADGSGKYVRAGYEVNITNGKEYWTPWQAIYGDEAVNKQGKFDLYVQHRRNYFTTGWDTYRYEFITESTNKAKRNHMLTRISNIHREYKAFAIRPYSHIGMAIYPGDGVTGNLGVVYDTRTQTAIREGLLYPFGDITDAIYIGNKLYVVSPNGNLYVYDETTGTCNTYKVTPALEDGKYLLGISYDRPNKKLYVNVSDGYTGSLDVSNRYIIYEADIQSGVYTERLNVQRTGYKGGDIEVFKGKAYILDQNIATGSENGTGLIVRVYDLSTQKLINKHTMSADMFPASLTIYDRELPVGAGVTDEEGIDFMDGRIYRWDTYVAVGCYRPSHEAFITTIAPEYTDGVNDGIGARLADWDAGDEVVTLNESILGNQVSKETIDDEITVTQYQKEGTNGIREVKFSKYSKYKLKLATRQAPEDVSPEDWQILFGQWNVIQGDSNSIKEFARHFNTPVMFTPGYIHYSEMDKDSSQREMAKGRDGLLIVDKDNNATVTTRGENNISEMFEATGLKGFHMGSMRYICKDGKITDGFGEVSNFQEDPNEKTGRVMLTEMRDGTRYVVCVTGHASQGTGWTHNEMIAYLYDKGIDDVKFCFNLDGGGTTRLYTKNDEGVENVTGSFVDDRTIRFMIYLDKEDHDSCELYLYDKDLRDKNESLGLPYNYWKRAKDAGLTTVPGTQYQI